MTVRMRKMRLVLTVAVLAACGGEPAAMADQAEDPAITAAPAAPAVRQPTTGAGLIEVRMTMTNGGSFEPARVEAGPGDVIRFVNVDNVHNVSFPKSRNSGAPNLPAPSPYLTAPGQTYDMVVGLAPGNYTFQCDPHAAMGMTGTLTIR